MLSKDIAKALKLKALGKSYAAIGRVFGISETAAKYWVEPDYRERVKEKSRIARRKRWLKLSRTDKKRDNQRTTDVLMRKRKLQPEYKEYSNQIHYKYAETKKASITRKSYWKRNKERLNVLQRKQYLKHKEARLEVRKRYYKENRKEILSKMNAYYQKNKAKILKRNKEKRRNNY